MENFKRKLAIKRSVQNNIPYGTSLMRSGDFRGRGGKAGGFVIPPAIIAAGVPLIADILKRPINKFLDWIGLGAGGAAYRSGGFWHKPGDLGVAIAPGRRTQQAALSTMSPFVAGQGIGGMIAGEPSSRDLKNIRVLENRLKQYADSPEKFMAKLEKIHAAGEGYLKKHRKKLKKKL